MLEKAGGSPELIDAVKKETDKRVLVDHLLALRGAKGLSQEDIAKHFGCSQSKISKLENGVDEDLRIGDLLSYCDAIGLDLSIGTSPKGHTAIDRIKQHAFCIQDELVQMVDLADDDEEILEGVAKAHVEVLFNLIQLISKSADKLPSHAQGDGQRIQIEARCRIAATSATPENIGGASTPQDASAAPATV